eukprot:3525161-Amphidinium_carterae.1
MSWASSQLQCIEAEEIDPQSQSNQHHPHVQKRSSKRCIRVKAVSAKRVARKCLFRAAQAVDDHGTESSSRRGNTHDTLRARASHATHVQAQEVHVQRVPFRKETVLSLLDTPTRVVMCVRIP